MSNVAINLVATMMQNKFSSNYANSVQGSTKSNFTNVLTKARGQSEDVSSNRKVNDTQETLGKAVDKGHQKVHERNRENFEKMNQKNKVDNQKNKDEQNPSKKVEKKPDDLTGDKTKETENEDTKIKGYEKVMSDEQLDETEMDLIEDIAEKLGLDTDKMTELLNELGMTVFNLFDMKNLKAFMTETLGASEQVELLTADGAVASMRDIMKTLHGALENNPEFAKLLAELKSEVVQTSVITSNETADESLENALEMLTTPGEEGKAQGQQNSGNKEGSLTQQNLTEQQSSGEKVSGDGTKAVGVKGAEAGALNTGFEGALNQVITQKTETIIMNGEVQTIRTEVTAKDVFDQIVTGLKVQVTEGKSSIMLQLNPQNLGKIALNLITENGNLTGHFVAESEAVKEVIESNLSQLKNQLQSQGINVGELKITVGNSTAFFTGDKEKDNTSNSSTNKSNKRFKIGNINGIFADNLIEDKIEEQVERLHENSSIELHA